MNFTYLLIALMATTLGSMAGLGGGVIIKPILDFLGDYSLSTISVLSSFTVFSMAIVSIFKQIRYKFKIELRKTILIGIGSILGGLIGENLINFIMALIDPVIVTMIQNLVLALHLILIYIYMNNKNKFKSYHVENFFGCISIGLLLGAIASFLSIGGGPINVCILTIFFSMNTKEAAVNSIVTILFSQGSKLLTIATSTGFSSFDLRILPFMIVGGILGGLIGSNFNKLVSEKYILKVFNMVVISLILLNSYNVISIFI
ncbi:sulfite exporter TauE/SafE family protein [Clostridium sp. LP20]|uniref:sulfite exporter TauE/SafE family protein n=1 Tax=Clostridium sp. LP20 TaxID=3418665 RepID=UPI003EE45BC7